MFFNGIVKLNKGDKIDLEIFNYDQMHRINALHLYKKKLNNDQLKGVSMSPNKPDGPER